MTKYVLKSETLYPHQREMADFMKSRSRCMCVSPMGSGKTRAVLSAFRSNVLVVAPLRVASMVWPEEAEAVGVDCVFMGSKGCTRRSADNFYATNFENPRIALPDGVDTLIIDESSKLKGFHLYQGTKRAKALYQLSKACKRVVLLTGTPCSENLGDLYSQLTFLDGGRLFGASKLRFMRRFCIDLSQDERYHRWEPRAGAYDEVMMKAATLAHYFEPTLKTFGHVDTTVKITPTKAQIQVIDSLRDGHHSSLADAEIHAANAGVLVQKLLHAASGFGYTESGGVTWLSDNKINELRGMLEDNSETRFVIVAYWRASLGRILSTFDNVTNDIAAFKDGKVRHLLISPAAAAHGLSLQQQSNHMILYEPWFSCEQYEQVLERIGERRQAQAGLNRPVYYHYLKCGEVEQIAWTTLQQKANVEQQLITYLKR